jgi:hypothetical protein
MATIILQGEWQRTSGGPGPTSKTPPSITATVASSPGRTHYATIGGVPYTFERVGTDASGNEIYRDQTRRN